MRALITLTDAEWNCLGKALAEAEAQRTRDAEEGEDGPEQKRLDKAMARDFARLARKLGL